MDAARNRIGDRAAARRRDRYANGGQRGGRRGGIAGGAALVDGSAVSGIRRRIDGVTTDLGTITRAATV